MMRVNSRYAYDLAIIGAGPAGYTAAFEAAARGMKTVLFEKDLFGGTCLNRGCVPTKYLAHVAELYAQVKRPGSYGYGIHSLDVKLDLAEMNAEKDRLITGLREGLYQKLCRMQVELVEAAAKLIGLHEISAGGRIYDAQYVLIATGSVPASPLFKGAVTSDGVLNPDRIPETLKILGGGVIAAEAAHIYRSFGSDVTICMRGKRMLRGFDREIAIGLMQNLRQKGVVIIPECTLQQMQEIPAELTLSATGRYPEFDLVQAQRLGMEFDGGIAVDQQGYTGVAGIYAVGDVIKGSPQLAHEAMEQGRRAVRAMAGETQPAPGTVTQCIYVSPEIACVGLSSEQAKELEIPVVTGKQVMAANARTQITAQGRGFVKLIAKADTGVILGAQLLCGRASDLAAELALAIDQKLTVDDLLGTVRPHPSYCEEIREAAAAVKRRWQEI